MSLHRAGRNTLVAVVSLALASLVHADVHKPEMTSNSVHSPAPGSTVQILKVPGPGKLVNAQIQANGDGVYGYAVLLVDGQVFYDGSVNGSQVVPRNGNDPVQHLVHTAPGYPISVFDITPPEAIVFEQQIEVRFTVQNGSAVPSVVGATVLTGAP